MGLPPPACVGNAISVKRASWVCLGWTRPDQTAACRVACVGHGDWAVTKV
jgi:hypothetical protein